MNLQQMHSFPKDHVRALFGLEPFALSQLLEAALPELSARRLAELNAKPNRKRAPGGGRPRNPNKILTLPLPGSIADIDLSEA